MAINFDKTFGADSNNSAQGSNQNRPAAQLWLNVGYAAPGANEDGSDRFVSLPVGIPVDTQEHVSTNSRNDDYAAFQAARNSLLDQIIAAGEGLAPGEAVDLNLTIQLRKVAGERGPVATDQTNKFVVPLELVAAK